jgi:hypothetical protein
MKLLDVSLFRAAPPRTMVWSISQYSAATGGHKIRIDMGLTRSDTLDFCDEAFSSDHGRTWSNPRPVETLRKLDTGTFRRHPRAGLADPVAGAYVRFENTGVLPTDNPLEGMKAWSIRYRVSLDGGWTDVVNEQVIAPGHTPERPLPGVWVGRNAIMIGDYPCSPIRIPGSGGVLLQPVQISNPGPDGHFFNPGGGYTYHNAAVLRGTWRPDYRIDWELSDLVRNDPDRSTRGCVEPTIAQLPGADGRILMVIRGSNDVKPHLPGYRWFSVSEDQGRTWSPVRPWTYTDGTPFHSPSSTSQLLTHSGGEIFWLGNITPHNPTGNLPRYPFVIGRVDARTLLLDRASVFQVDTCLPGDNPRMMLSNFLAHEDRETGDILINMTRSLTRGLEDWTSDALLYRVRV